MTFSTFSQHLSKIEATTKRLEMTVLLAKLFGELERAEVAPVCYLLNGRVVPQYEPLEFQMSTKMVLRTLALNFKQDVKELELQSKKVGDIGLVAQDLAEGQAGSKVSVLEVFRTLKDLAGEGGKGSQDRKVQVLSQLLACLDPISVKYVSRIVVGKLRLGFSDMTIIDALSWMKVGDKSLHEPIELAYQKRADIGYIATISIQHGLTALDSVSVSIGTPVVPALCQRLNTAQEIIEKMHEVLVEAKFDGTRIQIHVDKSKKNQPPVVRTFTRNLEESPAMFPELVEIVKDLDCQTCILDAEGIAIDPATGKLLPFQVTITRKRKHAVADAVLEVPLQFFVFDLLEKDGQSFVDRPLLERRAELKKLVHSLDRMVVTEAVQTSDPEQLHQFHEQQLAAGLEGAVIKKLTSIYQSGRKGYSWVKIKESEGQRGKLSDTIDCVVVGYYLAQGNRSEQKVGAVLVAVLSDEQLLTISKVGSGFSEELAAEFINKSKQFERADQPKQVRINKSLIPDVWLDPEIVIEVAADELTTSPLHTAGLALRFPRIVRIRHDKSWREATTLEELKGLQSGELKLRKEIES